MNRVNSILKGSPLIVSILYTSLGILWILYSDKLVLSWFDQPEIITQFQSYKGWLFVLMSGLILFLLMKKNNELLESAINYQKEISKKFRVTFNSAPLGIAHHKMDEGLIQVNETLCNMLGYSKKELQTLSFKDFIHPEDLPLGRELDKELATGKRSSYKMEKRYKNKNGEYFYGLVHKSMIQDEQNGSYFVAMLEDISEQKEIREKLSKSIKDKEVLLAEVHHRVRNNLALISAFFQLQAMNTNDEKIKAVLQDSLMRIKCLSLVHETYSKANEIAHINFGKYMSELVAFVDKTLNKSGNDVQLDTDIRSMQLNINQAIPAGLLCNEVLIRVYGKSFQNNSPGQIKLKLQEKEDEVILKISDNGHKKAASKTDDETSDLRSLIIDTLNAQLQGNLALDGNGKGDDVAMLRFQKRDYKGPSSTFNSKEGFQIRTQ